jgi:hypothetical protein
MILETAEKTFVHHEGTKITKNIYLDLEKLESTKNLIISGFFQLNSWTFAVFKLRVLRAFVVR